MVGSARQRYVQLYARLIPTSCNPYGQPAAGYHCYEDVLVSCIQTHAGVSLIFLTVPCWVLMQELGRQAGCISDSGVLSLMHSVDSRAPQAGGICGLLGVGG